MSTNPLDTARASTLREQLRVRSVPPKLAPSMGLFGATTLGLGSLLGAGLYVLTGLGAAAAGPALWVSFLVCGGLTMFSVLMFAELARGIPVSGGAYVYAYRQLGSFWGFMVGWLLAVGSVFACALYAYGFGAYLSAFFGENGVSPWVPRFIALGVVGLLTVVALRGGRGGDRVQRVLTWGNVAVLVLLVVASIAVIEPDLLNPHFPRGIVGVGGAVSIIYISFFGYQLIANNAEEVVEPERNVPRAMVFALLIALTIYLLVALTSVAVVPWGALAASDAPLVLVASESLGKTGEVIIGVGAVLASAGALNGTLSSFGRQLFAMGRDRMLPRAVGRITDQNVPAAALMAGGGLTALVAVSADLEFMATAANFALLSSMLPLSFALARLHRDAEVSAARRAIPWLALVANLGLLATLDLQTLMVGGLIIGAGLAVFIGYTHDSERRAQKGLTVALSERELPPVVAKGERILVPLANPETREPLYLLALALLPGLDGEIVALNVVRANPDEALHDALGRHSESNEALESLEAVEALATAHGATVRPVVHAARSTAQGLGLAARDERCSLVVMGYSGSGEGRPSQFLDEVLSHLNTDLVLYAYKGSLRPKRIGVALRGRDNLVLMSRVGTTFAELFDGSVTYLSAVEAPLDAAAMRSARNLQIEALRQHAGTVPFSTELLVGPDPLAALVERSRDLDLLIVGAAQTGLRERVSVGEISASIADRAECSVVIVRVVSTVERVSTGILPGLARRLRE